MNPTVNKSTHKALDLGTRLRIRSMIHVAAEPLPFSWPMRSFIHHNPLHGLENLPFDQAVQQGAELFHARGGLPREEYQRFLAVDKVDREKLETAVSDILAEHEAIPGIELDRWLMHLLTAQTQHCCLPMKQPLCLVDPENVHAALHGRQQSGAIDIKQVSDTLRTQLLAERPVYESIDAIYGTRIGTELDELVIKSCLEFFDEGQSAWGMPEREQGFFTAWRDVARRNVRFFLRGLHIGTILEVDDTPEGIIAYVMQQLEIPEDKWMGYFTRELARLHGWAGFIRWRSTAKHYYWTHRYPADLVDFMAVRLSLVLAILNKSHRHHIEHTRSAIEQAIEDNPKEIYLRYELHTRNAMPEMAHRIEMTITDGKQADIERLFDEYVALKQARVNNMQASSLLALATSVGDTDALKKLDPMQLAALLYRLHSFEKQESMIWLKAMESHAIKKVSDKLNISAPKPREKRPFAQALFCIDTRSERIRRHLESVGDYQTFGIAGFFGVPVSFMALGKGSETHLCPVLLTPKNLVTEISSASHYSEAALSALEHAMHELKESVLTPFVTVEAIGLLFGFDMVGKTIAPQHYTRWRKRLSAEKPATRLLLDKLDREQADSIVRAVQRAMIVAAIEQQFGVEPGQVTDDMIRELRENALGNQSGTTKLAESLQLDEKQERDFIQRLRHDYRINRPYAQRQMERLGRIGFTIEEQTMYVGQALRAIGLINGFSRFVLLVGHGSTSENNPFESALDCGACGGNHGLVNARVLAQMANKLEVRRRLSLEGIDIPDDTTFVPAFHNTTTDEIRLHNLELLPPPHLIYIDRLYSGLSAASRLCAQERMPTLGNEDVELSANAAYENAQRNAMDWSQVRPEWGLSRNAYFFIGQRNLTEHLSLNGRAFLHSYDYRIDPKQRLLETILTGPLVVVQWINMEHYFSTVDNERFGSGSKVYHNVACRFGVMSGNLSDLRTGLPSQTVLKDGHPYHEPMRLITVIEAPLEHARLAIDAVATVKTLITNGWIRLMVVDPESATVNLYDNGTWVKQAMPESHYKQTAEEPAVS
jgi:uncharacterized protein YbcC (UPF0753/DUF2309 family)